MQIDIQSIRFTSDTKLIDYTEKKIGKLDTFFDKIQRAEVYLKLENGNAQVKDKVAEVRLFLPGVDIFAKNMNKSFEESIDECFEDLRKQIMKRKEKLQEK